MRLVEDYQLVEGLAVVPGCGENPHHHYKKAQGLILLNPRIPKINNNRAARSDEAT